MDTTVAHSPPRRRTDSSSRGPPALAARGRGCWTLRHGQRPSSPSPPLSLLDSSHIGGPSILQPQTPRLSIGQPTPLPKQAGYAGPGPRRAGGSEAETEVSAVLVGVDMGRGSDRQHGLVP